MKILYFGSLNYSLFLETVKLWVSNRSWCFLVVLFVFSQILLLMSKVIQECWTCNPKARLTILRIKKTLNQLLNQPQCKKVKDTNKCWGPRLEGLWHCDWLPAKLWLTSSPSEINKDLLVSWQKAGCYYRYM